MRIDRAKTARVLLCTRRLEVVGEEGCEHVPARSARIFAKRRWGDKRTSDRPPASPIQPTSQFAVSLVSSRGSPAELAPREEHPATEAAVLGPVEIDQRSSVS